MTEGLNHAIKQRVKAGWFGFLEARASPIAKPIGIERAAQQFVKRSRRLRCFWFEASP
jgi:hypothetical protein